MEYSQVTLAQWLSIFGGHLSLEPTGIPKPQGNQSGATISSMWPYPRQHCSVLSNHDFFNLEQLLIVLPISYPQVPQFGRESINMHCQSFVTASYAWDTLEISLLPYLMDETFSHWGVLCLPPPHFLGSVLPCHNQKAAPSSGWTVSKLNLPCVTHRILSTHHRVKWTAIAPSHILSVTQSKH